MGQGGIACPKPEPMKRTKARKARQKLTNTHEVRAYVFARERDICRCCRCRPAHSMHEMRPKSLGGRVSKRNSVAVCGSGSSMCHGFLQAYQIVWDMDPEIGAEGRIIFTPKSERAAEHMKIKFGESILSRPMRDVEHE